MIQPSASDLPFDAFATYAVLCATRLRLRASYHSILSGIEGSPGSPLRASTPWSWYQSDPSAEHVGQFVLGLPMLESMANMNANGMVIWHHTCMGLAADLPMFDRAAGQDGPESARAAQQYIAAWSATAGARRCCVHASQAFRVMMERRANEGVMFTAVPLLFKCALVLGFYVLARAQNGQTVTMDISRITYDLLEPVDWAVVGKEGFCEPETVAHDHNRATNSAIAFIRGETEMSFGHDMRSPSYQSARLIMLEFAGLLDDIATRWKLGDYANILRILSDTMFEDSA